MDDTLKIKLYTFTMDCIDHNALAAFYAALIEWTVVFSDDDYACVAPPGSEHGAYPCILFQRNPAYQQPVWPDAPDKQQQMAHLDLAVNDVEKAVQHAIHCGATVAQEQFSDDWRVMFDPEGHPFCLCDLKSVMESEHFALR